MHASRALRALAPCLAWLATFVVQPPLRASAVPTSVDVSPPIPSPSDAVTLDVLLEWPSTGYAITEATPSFPETFSIELDVYVSAPAPDEAVIFIPTSESVSAHLGLLEAGTWSYTVREWQAPRGPFPVLELAGTLTGSFTVVPEPGARALLGLGLGGLALAARRRGDARARGARVRACRATPR